MRNCIHAVSLCALLFALVYLQVYGIIGALKTLYIFDNIVKDQYSHLAYPNMHKKRKRMNIWAQMVIEIARE